MAVKVQRSPAAYRQAEPDREIDEILADPGPMWSPSEHLAVTEWLLGEGDPCGFKSCAFHYFNSAWPAFRLVGVFFLCCIPLLLLFKRRRGASPPEVSMH